MSDELEQSHPELLALRAKAIRRKRVLIASGVLLAALIVGLLAFNAIASIASRHTLLDCTAPTGKCYHQSQERTGQVITGLITTLVGAGQDRAAITREVTRAAAICNNKFPRPVGENVFRVCIDKEMRTK